MLMLALLEPDALPAPSDLEVIDMDEPRLATMSVTVPEGYEAGTQMSVPVADGHISVTVPGGLTPGMAFEVPCLGYGPRAPPVAPPPAC